MAYHLVVTEAQRQGIDKGMIRHPGFGITVFLLALHLTQSHTGIG